MMKLSEALRLGGMTWRQAFGVGREYEGGGKCALIAAYDAAGIAINNQLYGDLPEPWLLWLTRLECCPQCCLLYGDPHDQHELRQSVLGIIVHLNDDHRWSGSQIADWVETLEADVPQPEAPVYIEVLA